MHYSAHGRCKSRRSLRRASRSRRDAIYRTPSLTDRCHMYARPMDYVAIAFVTRILSLSLALPRRRICMQKSAGTTRGKLFHDFPQLPSISRERDSASMRDKDRYRAFDWSLRGHRGYPGVPERSEMHLRGSRGLSASGTHQNRQGSSPESSLFQIPPLDPSRNRCPRSLSSTESRVSPAAATTVNLRPGPRGRAARTEGSPATEEIKAFVEQRRKKGPIIAGHGVKWLLEIETRVGRLTNPSSHLNWIDPAPAGSFRD